MVLTPGQHITEIMKKAKLAGKTMKSGTMMPRLKTPEISQQYTKKELKHLKLKTQTISSLIKKLAQLIVKKESVPLESLVRESSTRRTTVMAMRLKQRWKKLMISSVGMLSMLQMEHVQLPQVIPMPRGEFLQDLQRQDVSLQRVRVLSHKSTSWELSAESQSRPRQF